MIRFSSDANGVRNVELLAESASWADDFFELEDHSDQIPASEETLRQMVRWCPFGVNLIYDDDTLVGWTFLFPTSRGLMDRFLADAITEAELFVESEKAATEENFDALYLCSAVILPTYRRQGLATAGFLKSIERYGGIEGALLFAWPLTDAGRATVESLARQLDTQILLKD